MVTEGESERGRPRRQKRAQRPRWWEYEREVAELVDGLESGTTVEHDQRVTGRISGVLRQLDALVQGQLAGQPVSIAIEAKRYGRSVSIGTVDEFIGKMLDVGCDRGVLYAAGGFTEGALKRASNARNPAVGCVHLAPSAEASLPDAGNVVTAPDGLTAPGSVASGSGRVYQAGRESTVLEVALDDYLDRLVGPNRTDRYDVWLARIDVVLYRQ
ncbi:restriction endonuclease [Streptomyces nigrescens]|uniref:restriction endonuclease n=1 Tax=Streptomyces nigrescens TaxID=1920 RepID=UPI00225BD071|nr:restriction endonuclease [Streptomyces libani]MCX5445998.1 restriction endonuclease [Streptomyces libani]